MVASPDTIFYLVVIIGFLVIAGLYMQKTEQDAKKGDRLRTRRFSHEEAALNTPWRKLFVRLADRAMAAGLDETPDSLQRQGSLAGFVLGVVTGLAVQSFIVAFLCIPAGYMFPLFKVLKAEKRLDRLIEMQTVQAAEKMLSVARQNPSLLHALEAACEVENPLGREFQTVTAAIRNGQMDIQGGLIELQKRIRTPDMNLLTNGLIIANRIGGGVAVKALTSTVSAIRNREADRSAVRIATAAGNSTLKVVGCTPGVAFVLAMLFKFDYMEPMITTFWGWVALSVAAFLNLVGYLVTKKVLNVKDMVKV